MNSSVAVSSGCCSFLPSLRHRLSGPQLEVAKRVAYFVLFSAIVVGAIYGGSQLFDMKIDFSAQAGGLIAGGGVALLAAGIVFTILAKKYGTQILFDRKVQIAGVVLGIIVVLGLSITAGVKTDVFSSQLQGLAVGFGFTALVIGLVHQYRLHQNINKALTNAGVRNIDAFYATSSAAFPGLERISKTRQVAYQIATFVFLIALFCGMLVGGAKLFDGNLDALKGQIGGLVVGSTVTLITLGILYLAREKYNEYRENKLRKQNYGEDAQLITYEISKDPIYRFYLVAAITALAIAAILHFAGVINLKELFNQWQGVAAGAALTAVVAALTLSLRNVASLEELSRKLNKQRADDDIGTKVRRQKTGGADSLPRPTIVDRAEDALGYNDGDAVEVDVGHPTTTPQHTLIIPIAHRQQGSPHGSIRSETLDD